VDSTIRTYRDPYPIEGDPIRSVLVILIREHQMSDRNGGPYVTEKKGYQPAPVSQPRPSTTAVPTRTPDAGYQPASGGGSRPTPPTTGSGVKPNK
jgi:hypothetical protein